MKSYIKSAIFALAAPMLFTACSSDSNNEPTPAPEKFEGIMLSIPANNLSTRGFVDTPTENEAKINSLTIVAYMVKDSKGTAVTNANPKVIPVDVNKITVANGSNPAYPVESTSNTTYGKVPVALSKGSYHIYLFANLTASQLATVSNGTETDLTDETLKTTKETAYQTARIKLSDALITDAVVNGTSQSKYLPMSCYYTDVKKDTSGTNFGTDDATVGEVVINTGEPTSVYANLTLAVAKVRISLTNNSTPGLTLSGSPKLQKLNTSLSLFGGDNAEKLVGANTVDVTGSYFTLGEAFGADNKLTDSKTFENVDIDKLRKDALTTVGNELWTWYSQVFICERLYAADITDANKVQLEITHSSGEKTTHALTGTSGKGFVRSTCYEIVGEIDGKTVTLQVRVKPWVYNKAVHDLDEDYE